MAADPSRSALYARLQDVLGIEHADALMTYLPPQPPDELATKAGLNALEVRFDRLEHRFDRLEARFDRLEDRFDLLENRFDRIEDRFDRFEERFDRVHEAMRDHLRTYTLAMVGSMTALTAIYAGLLTVVT